jgi:hypothetical protein
MLAPAARGSWAAGPCGPSMDVEKSRSAPDRRQAGESKARQAPIRSRSDRSGNEGLAKNRGARVGSEPSPRRRRARNRKQGYGVMLKLFHRVWPPAALAVGLIATMAWIGVLGYELFKLSALTF